MVLTVPTVLIVIATVLFGYAVYQAKWRSPTAWAFFLWSLAFCWPLIR